MVGFAVDEVGRPLFSFSSISTHKQDLLVDPKASFMVAHKDFKVGVPEREREALGAPRLMQSCHVSAMMLCLTHSSAGLGGIARDADWVGARPLS